MNSNADKSLLESKEVITKYELFGIIFLFTLILIIFFPKGRIEKLLFQETKNYDLSIKYLEGLSKAYPKNIDFKIALLKFYIKIGKLKEALRLITICKSDKRCIKNIDFLKNSYLFYKVLYFKNKNKLVLEETKKFLGLIIKFAKPNLYHFALKESISMNFPDLQYLILKKIIKIEPNEEYLKRFVFLSIYYKDYTDAIKILKSLYQKTKNPQYLEKEAQIYGYIKKLEIAKNLYLKLFESVKQEDLKRKYFINALNILLWNKRYKEASYLAEKYENYFLNSQDYKALKKILKTYLQTNNLGLARELSIKILKEQNR